MFIYNLYIYIIYEDNWEKYIYFSIFQNSMLFVFILALSITLNGLLIYFN